MNIVLYSISFLPTLGGREFVVHHLANALIQLGHRARVVGPAGFWKYRKVKLPYPVHRWPTLRGRLPEHVMLAHLKMDVAIWGADVIHAHTTYPNGYTALRLKRRRSIPVVITPHGIDIQSIPELGHGQRLDPVLNDKIEGAVQQADLVTAISGAIESAIVDAGARSDRIRRIPNGVDAARFDLPTASDLRQWLGLDEDARLLTTVGKHNPRKGQEFVIRAMPKVLVAEPRARLVIVGENTDRLLPLIAELGLEAKVILTGGLPPPRHALLGMAGGDDPRERDRYAEILCGSELYVSAGIQKESEGLSLAVLEGMAARLPIVATSISGNVDVVEDGRNGVLVTPADADSLADGIIRVLGSPDQEAMREAARETALRYGWLNVARQYVATYEEAIAAAR